MWRESELDQIIAIKAEKSLLRKKILEVTGASTSHPITLTFKKKNDIHGTVVSVELGSDELDAIIGRLHIVRENLDRKLSDFGIDVGK